MNSCQETVSEKEKEREREKEGEGTDEVLHPNHYHLIKTSCLESCIELWLVS